MKKHLLLLTLFSFYFLDSSAQYATKGSGTLKNEIWWFDWAGFTVSNGASRTFNTTDGLTVTISFSNVSSLVPVPNVMNTWNGAILHLLYDFTDPAVKPALLSTSNPGVCSFTMTIAAYRAGVQVPFTFITADAEASLPSEITTLKTDGSNWQTITLFRNSSQTSNPLTGCNTQTVTITDTYANAPQTGQNPIVGTSSGSGSMAVEVALNHTVFGGMAVAFGIMAPIDRSDLPSSYGAAQHFLSFNINNGCRYLPPLPFISHAKPLYLGALPGDADGYQTTDDNASGVDEECISSFPAYTNGSGTYSLQVPLVNTTGSNAYLSGWFDYNRNGIFDIGENATAVVSNIATTATLTWTGLPAYLPVGTATGYGFRFRISADQVSVQNPAGNAPDGEVEDYFVASAVLCAPISVSTIADTSLCPGKSVQLTTTGTGVMQYIWNTSSYLDNGNIASPLAMPAATTNYIVTGSTPQACEAKDTVTVSVLSLPVISISNDVAICSGTNTQLLAASPGAVSYSWSPQTHLNNSAIGNPIAAPSATTEYVVLVQGSNGCYNKDSVTITTIPLPAISITNDVTICSGNNTQLTATAPGAVSYNWSPQTGLDNAAINNPTAAPTSATEYVVLVQGSNGCFNRDTVNVSLMPLPVISITNDVTICSGRNTQLSATAPGAVLYSWTPQAGLDNSAISNPTAAPVADTKYVVLVEGSNGCLNKDSVNVLVRPLPVFGVNTVQPVCEKQSLLLSASGGDHYTWYAKDNSVVGNSASVTVQPDLTQDYRVLIEDNTCQMSSTLTVPVTVNEMPEAAIAKTNDIDCSHNQAVLHVSGGAGYTWDAAAGITDYTSPDPVVSPLKTTTYYVKVTGSNGCTVKDSVTVAVDIAKAMSTFAVPSAFTPNNDGKNDCFGLKYLGSAASLQFDIYNRWGQRVFSAGNANQCWDGTLKGIQQPPGGYVYQIKATTDCGTVSRKGIVMLIR